MVNRVKKRIDLKDTTNQNFVYLQKKQIMDTWLEIYTNEEVLLLLSSPETSPRCQYKWDTEDEDELLLSPPEAQTTEIPDTPGKTIGGETATKEDKPAEVHSPIYMQDSPVQVDGIPPTPGRGTVWNISSLKISVPVKSTEDQPYQVLTENGTYFEITSEEMEKVPFMKIKKMKKKKYTVFLKNNRSVRVKMVNNKFIWFNYRDRSQNSE